MKKVKYFKANTGKVLEEQINKFAEEYEIIQIEYNSSNNSCMILYNEDKKET